MIATQAEMEHEVRRLRAENGDLRAALANEAEALERDTEEAERRASRFWFAAWGNSQRIVRALREEIARLKEQRRG